ncbi:hypothetical protein QBC46DRAFT_338302 [Diplogelasinospora grovesii]|uniref:N-acetyltransferase domain-containing protein n=1 Tax=Diplogelasinospora grovesii TaxID=303347 RepID=A0AAN6NF43_9PEZI|nr:hypothetical protein QBC46DRAFT_338302 [Diplogelasinospora grovesii]
MNPNPTYSWPVLDSGHGGSPDRAWHPFSIHPGAPLFDPLRAEISSSLTLEDILALTKLISSVKRADKEQLLSYDIPVLVPSSHKELGECWEARGGIDLATPDLSEPRTMRITYRLSTDCLGRGVLTEAIWHFTRWAFRAFPGINRIEAAVKEGAETSACVLIKAGYRSEGCRRKAGYDDGLAFDVHMYGILRENCPEVPGVAGRVRVNKQPKPEDTHLDIFRAVEVALMIKDKASDDANATRRPESGGKNQHAEGVVGGGSGEADRRARVESESEGEHRHICKKVKLEAAEAVKIKCEPV